MLRLTYLLLSILVMMTAVTGCTSKPKSGTDAESQLGGVSAQQWAALSRKPIYFGHQSVGANIVEGVHEVLAKRPDISLRIAAANDATSPGLHEFLIGENGNPASKLRSFAEMVDRDRPPADSILVMKFCFVDMKRETDVPALFQQYKTAVEQLHSKYPGRSLVHVTMPLTTVESAPDYMLRRLLGRYSRREVNAKRNQFNRLLRNEYGGKEPIFDLADYESLRADGSRGSYTLNHEVIYAMAPEWTSDGGHLNDLGRRHVAEKFLVRLATLSSNAAKETNR